MKKNYILIDYENVQPEAIPGLEQDHFNIFIFLGANQPKISAKVASAMQALGNRAKYVQLTASGSNALDFHIAYYIGHLSTTDPDAFFHIVSKDTGFDPLIKYLKGRKIFCDRVKSISDIPLLKTSVLKSLPERVAAVVEKLTNLGTAGPRRLKALQNIILNLFSQSLSEREVSDIISKLQEQSIVVIEKSKVSCSPPSKTASAEST